MRVKEVKKEYEITKSKIDGLNHKLMTLDNLLAQGNLDLLDKLLAEAENTRQELKKLERNKKQYEADFKFLVTGIDKGLGVASYL